MDSLLSVNSVQARFFWNLKSCIKTTSVNGVERYICLFDVVDMTNMLCYRYFTSLISTRRKDNVWEKTKLVFIPASENSLDLEDFFYKLLENVRNIEPYQFSKEILNECISIFPAHCFTFECLRAMFILFYDFYLFEKLVTNNCSCGDFLLNKCNCLHLFATTIRSFYFVEMTNSKLIGVNYVYIDSDFIDNAIKYM